MFNRPGIAIIQTLKNAAPYAVRLIFSIVLLGSALQNACASADARKGAQVFLQCQACHSIAGGGPAHVGPPLGGVVGRKAAFVPGYTYSAALKASGLVWTPETLDRWLTRPSALVPGTRMAFIGLPNPALRQDVIAYLSTLH